jgi:ergothioneine biosynthesis protein EgtB
MPMATKTLAGSSLSHDHSATNDLADRFCDIRRQTEELCRPLAIEDYGLQSMPEASPPKWHLAHTTWFFETFLLCRFKDDYRPFHPEFNFLFNSYYNAAGPRWARPERGLLSRPTVEEVYDYRRSIDDEVSELLSVPKDQHPEVSELCTLGLNHEQQHQELILTDIKHAFAKNPLRPVYHQTAMTPGAAPPASWIDFPGGIVEIGHRGPGFAFDNESPRHRVLLDAYRLAGRLTTNAEYQAFMAGGGYQRPEYWLSDGWATRQAYDWNAPLYWHETHDGWLQMTLGGWKPVAPDEPLCHVSYYEADAYARWAGARLPTEAEWETAARQPLAGHFLEAGHFHPRSATAGDDSGPVHALYGDVWQWTASPYVPYPGYQPAAGALGEYNGKFMCNQMVLRGASCVTPQSHARPSYRNFFPPEARWQFAGIRLAKDVK